MPKSISGVVIEKSDTLSFTEFCSATRIQPEIILQMIEYQLVEPEGETPDKWRFDSLSLKRGRIAASLYRDLEVNMAGIALALELLDKIEILKQELAILQKGNV